MTLRALAPLALLPALALAACGDDEVDPLRELHDEVFVVSCGGLECHLDGQSEGGLNLDYDSGLMDRLLAQAEGADLPRVVPGDPDSSYLYLKLTDQFIEVDGDGERMPLGRSALTSAKIASVAEWIRSLE